MKLQYGFGAAPSVGTTDAQTTFTEQGENRLARRVIVKNTGSVTVYILFNVPVDQTARTALFGACSPIQLLAGAELDFFPPDADSAALRNIGYKTAASTSTLLITAV